MCKRLLLVSILAAGLLHAQESRKIRMVMDGGRRLSIDETTATFVIELSNAADLEQAPASDEDAPPLFKTLYPTFAAARNSRSFGLIPSVAEIDGVSSELDDRIMAALERAMSAGVPGRFIGREGLLARLEALACAPDEGPACAFVSAAREIGGAESRPAKDRKPVDALKATFLASAMPSIGIYSSAPELDRIFQQAKFLQQRLDRSSPMAQALRRALESDAKLLAEYRLLNDLPAAITSWLAVPDLVRAGAEDREVAVFPASRSPEGDFIKAKWGGRPVPEDVRVLQEIASAVRSGRLGLKPAEKAGWYDHRLFALEPLVREEAAVERPKVSRGPGYQQACEDTFVALLTRRREAHAKQLEIPGVGSAAQIALFVRPAFRLEPQPTLYRRTADSYAFLKKRLGDLGGAHLLQQPMAGIPPFRGATLDEVLASAEKTYRTLERMSLDDLGLGSGTAASESADVAADLDPRVAVPFAYDVERKRYRCSAVIGVRVVEGDVKYAAEPSLSLTNADGVPIDPKDQEIVFEGQPIAFAIPVVEEFWSKTPVTREELRRLCDSAKTHEKIRAALQALR